MIAKEGYIIYCPACQIEYYAELGDTFKCECGSEMFLQKIVANYV